MFYIMYVIWIWKYSLEILWKFDLEISELVMEMIKVMKYFIELKNIILRFWCDEFNVFRLNFIFKMVHFWCHQKFYHSREINSLSIKWSQNIHRCIKIITYCLNLKINKKSVHSMINKIIYRPIDSTRCC